MIAPQGVHLMTLQCNGVPRTPQAYCESPQYVAKLGLVLRAWSIAHSLWNNQPHAQPVHKSHGLVAVPGPCKVFALLQSVLVF